MNIELEKALTDLINKSLSGIDAAKDFLSAEVPDVLTQLLMWHGVYNFVLFCVGIMGLCLIFYGNYRQFKWWKKELNGNDSMGEHPEVMLNLFQIFIIFPCVLSINLEWLQVWIAPKVWLLEYAAKIAK